MTLKVKVSLLFSLQVWSSYKKREKREAIHGCPLFTPAVHQQHDKLPGTTDPAVAAIYLLPHWAKAVRPRLCCHGNPKASNSHHGNFQDVPCAAHRGRGLHDLLDHRLLGRRGRRQLKFSAPGFTGTTATPATVTGQTETSDYPPPFISHGHRCLCQPVSRAGNWWTHRPVACGSWQPIREGRREVHPPSGVEGPPDSTGTGTSWKTGCFLVFNPLFSLKRIVYFSESIST